MEKNNITLEITQRVRKAIGDEWLAQVQYWVGALNIDDENEDAVSEFIEHEGDEWDHADRAASWLRNIPGCGALPCSPKEICQWKHCGYIYPYRVTRASLVEDAMKGEKCAIRFYTDFIDMTGSGTYYGPDIGEMLERILAKEKEHLRDLEKL